LGIEDVRGKKQRRNDAFVAKETGHSEPRSLVPSEGGKPRNRRGSVVEFAMVVRSEASLIVSFALRQAQRDTGCITRTFFLVRSPSAHPSLFIIAITHLTYNVLVPPLQHFWPLGPEISHQRSLRSSFAHLRRFSSACFCYLYRATYRSTPATTLQVIQPLEVVLRSRRRRRQSLAYSCRSDLGIEDVRGKKQRRNDAFVAKETGHSEPRSLVPSEGGKPLSAIPFIFIGNTSSGVYNPDVLPCSFSIRSSIFVHHRHHSSNLQCPRPPLTALLASGTRDLAPTFAAIFIRASPTLQLRLFLLPLSCYISFDASDNITSHPAAGSSPSESPSPTSIPCLLLPFRVFLLSQTHALFAVD
ncbi:hypothetical protein MJO28_009517, partial [Puccinia striiformis f. sp. tritici]